MTSGSGCNLWVWLVVVVVRRYIYRFPHITYPYSSCIYMLFFAAASLLLHFFKWFSFLFKHFYVIKLYVLNKFLPSINTHTGIPRQPYERPHIMFYKRRSTHKKMLYILLWT